MARPNKPTALDEHAWQATVRKEIAAIDPGLLLPRRPSVAAPVPLEALDLDLLAAMAVVDAAMGSAICHATARVELDTVHRFRDPDYAALTLRLRDAGNRDTAATVAAQLTERGHVERVDHHDAARDRMVNAYFDWGGRRVALVSATNGDADAINDAIQRRQVDRGELDASVVAWGMGEQRILVGDTVQTRRNDPRTGVEDCAQWIVRAIHADGIDLASSNDSGEPRRVSPDYALQHLQLAYASTVHGIQGETPDAAIVGPDVDAAGLYVGSPGADCTTCRSPSRVRTPRPGKLLRRR